MCQKPQILEWIHRSRLWWENRVTAPYQRKLSINAVFNFTFGVKHLQWRNSNCKKEKWASFCKQGRYGAGAGARWEAQSQNRFLLLQEKLRPGTWRAGFSPPHSNCPWWLRVRAQTERIPWGWRVGAGPAAVKHHFCILQQECLEPTACALF